MTGTTWTPEARAAQAAKEAAQPKKAAGLSPSLNVVKKSKGPVMTVLEELAAHIEPVHRVVVEVNRTVAIPYESNSAIGCALFSTRYCGRPLRSVMVIWPASRPRCRYSVA